MHRGFLFLLSGFALSLHTTAALAGAKYDPQPWVQKALELKLATHPQWLNLGHYQTSLFSYRSQADGLGFFLAGAPGKTNPEAELVATLKAFFSPLEIQDPKTQQHPICQFPARFDWLREKLKWSTADLPAHDCSRWDRYRQKLAAKSATLVFSTYYMNSPASAFGHTFLRLNKTPAGQTGERYELLDYGINYAATVDTNNAFLYGVKGLLGFFQGSFTAIPYFYKVREYNDSESRDLWEYDLRLSQEEVDRLVAHTWELGSTHMDYWYLDENCSYHMLTLLDAAAPRLQLSFRQKPIVIPADTLRTAADSPELIQSVRFRPSIQTQFLARYQGLNTEEKELFQSAVKSHDPSGIRSAAVLDTASDYIDLNHWNDTLDPKSDASRWKESLLQARASLGVRSPHLALEPSSQERPETGHRSSRFGLDTENRPSAHTASIGFQFRLALHDRLDLSQGYPETSEMGFLNTRLEWLTAAQKIRLSRLHFVEATTFNPLGQTIYKPSWSVRLLMDRDLFGLCTNQECLTAGVDGGAGISWGIGGTWARPRFLFWTLAMISTRFGGFDHSKWIPSVGPDVGVRIRLMSRWNFALSAQGKWMGLGIADVNRVWGVLYRAETRLALSDQWALNAHWTKTPVDSDTGRWGAAIFHYF